MTGYKEFSRKELQDLGHDEMRPLVREMAKRSLYAHLRSILASIRRSDNPILTFVGATIAEDGLVRAFSVGASNEILERGAMDFVRVYLDRIFDARRTGVGDKGLGDGIKKNVETGKPEIVCGEDDKTEADREKAENGCLLIKELMLVAVEFYGEELTDVEKLELLSIQKRMEFRLRALDQSTFYWSCRGEAMMPH